MLNKKMKGMSEMFFSMETIKMMKVNRTILLLLFMLFATAASQAQMRQVTTYYNKLVYDYEYVDIKPQFPGGERSMINFINETREYPYNAYHRRIQGRVLCSFIVGTDGKLFNIEVIKGSGDETLDREAMRVISKMPKWTVGRNANSKVNVRCILPISFRL